MHFRGHRGFILARQVVEISGVFCRDHALEAYAAAQRISLKGMWFSGGSILFGALSSLWDSAKLLDLPGEVKDEPWIVHIFGCPACKTRNVSTAGPTICQSCGEHITVVSCGTCGVIQAKGGDLLQGRHKSVCHACGKSTEAIHGCRNWPALLVGQAACECCAEVAAESTMDADATQSAYRQSIRWAFSFNEDTFTYLDQYYSNCRAGNRRNTFDGCLANCGERLSLVIIPLIIGIARAGGSIDAAARAAVERIARKLGIDARKVFGDAESHAESTTSRPWWDVLGVPADATFEQATFAYRRLASLFHPDRWMHASELQRDQALARMKEVNAAFDIAKVRCVRTSKTNSTRPTSSSVSDSESANSVNSDTQKNGLAESDVPQGATDDSQPAPSHPRESNGAFAYCVCILAISICLALAVAVASNNGRSTATLGDEVEREPASQVKHDDASSIRQIPRPSIDQPNPLSPGAIPKSDSGDSEGETKTVVTPNDSRKHGERTAEPDNALSNTPPKNQVTKHLRLTGRVTAVSSRGTTACVVRFSNGPISRLVGERGRVYRDGRYLGEYSAEAVKELALAGTCELFVPAIGDVVVFEMKTNPSADP